MNGFSLGSCTTLPHNFWEIGWVGFCIIPPTTKHNFLCGGDYSHQLLTMWRSRCIWEPSCCSWTSWRTSSSCRWGGGRWCRPPRRAGKFPASATSGHWQPRLRQGQRGEDGTVWVSEWEVCEEKTCENVMREDLEEQNTGSSSGLTFSFLSGH